MQKTSIIQRVGIGLYLLCGLSYVVFYSWLAWPASAASKDAIAIRVIANPQHYSPARWYKEQRFSGSPQSITVDGYDAVRDGRTVYVNVGNVSGSRLYTNIYLISYNQDAENATLDIFGQILSHWKFNKNIVAPGTCKTSTATTCVTDAGCPSGDYCLAPKAKIIRDIKRLADLADMTKAVEDYKLANGRYPVLRAGSYITNRTISVWPSWTALSGIVNFRMPVDPVNKLGPCAINFNPITCWDEASKRFAAALPALPPDSLAYIYTVAADGSNYWIYLSTESGTLGAGGSFTYTGGGVSAPVPTGTTGTAPVNSPPVFMGSNLPAGHEGTAYAGFISASDPEGANLTWSVTGVEFTSSDGSVNAAWSPASGTSLPVFLTSSCSWTAPSILDATAVAGQRSISAAGMGMSGDYVFTITVDDGSGAANSTAVSDFTILSAGGCVFDASDPMLFRNSPTPANQGCFIQ